MISDLDTSGLCLSFVQGICILYMQCHGMEAIIASVRNYCNESTSHTSWVTTCYKVIILEIMYHLREIHLSSHEVAHGPLNLHDDR